MSRRGDWFLQPRQDASHKRGLWRRTTLDEYRKASPKWETVLDLDALATAEKENWVWAGAECLGPDYRRCLISLSRGGADAKVVREFDTVAKAFVAGGFALPEAKSDVAWVDADTLYVGTQHRLPRLDDRFGLPAHSQALEARHAAGRGEDRVRGPARETSWSACR